MKSIKGIAIFCLMSAMLLLTGCGEKKCFFVSTEGGALEANAPVVWYDAFVGRVNALDEVADGTKVSIQFNKKFANEIRDGVAGRVVNDPKISPKAFVLLVGGREKDRALVANGSQIPESKAGSAVAEGFSAFVDWLRNSRTDELKIVGAALLLLVVLIKFVGKMFKFVLLVGALCAIGYVCVTANIDWGLYKERLVGAKATAQEAGTWLMEHGEKLQTILETALETDE